MPRFTAWSNSSLPGILIWAGIQLIVGLYANMDAVSLMVLVIVFKSSVLLFSMSKSVCIVIWSLVSLTYSIVRRMAVISASSTDAEL